jgi:hypothetical protein
MYILRDLRTTARSQRAKESSKDFLVGPAPKPASIDIHLHDSATVEINMAIERAKNLDVEDLAMEDWSVVDQINRINKLARIGEGAGGSVMKCVLTGHKTVFAIRLVIPYAPLLIISHDWI